MTLVKLTQVAGPDVYVNPAHVVRVEPGSGPDAATVTLSDGSTVAAAGSPAEVAGRLTPQGPDQSSARVYD